MCLLMTYTQLVVTENESMHPNIEFNHQIKVCYNLKANKADCFVCLFDSLRSSQHFFSYVGTGLSMLKSSTKQRKCVLLNTRTQHSDAGEARTQGPSVSSRALYL